MLACAITRDHLIWRPPGTGTPMPVIMVAALSKPFAVRVPPPPTIPPSRLAGASRR
jgi:hypothetical protein